MGMNPPNPFKLLDVYRQHVYRQRADAIRRSFYATFAYLCPDLYQAGMPHSPSDGELLAYIEREATRRDYFAETTDPQYADLDPVKRSIWRGEALQLRTIALKLRLLGIAPPAHLTTRS